MVGINEKSLSELIRYVYLNVTVLAQAKLRSSTTHCRVLGVSKESNYPIPFGTSSMSCTGLAETTRYSLGAYVVTSYRVVHLSITNIRSGLPAPKVYREFPNKNIFKTDLCAGCTSVYSYMRMCIRDDFNRYSVKELWVFRPIDRKCLQENHQQSVRVRWNCIFSWGLWRAEHSCDSDFQFNPRTRLYIYLSIALLTSLQQRKGVAFRFSFEISRGQRPWDIGRRRTLYMLPNSLVCVVYAARVAGLVIDSHQYVITHTK